MKKTCKKCGATFETNTPRKVCKQCSSTPGKNYEKICPVCGRAFNTDYEYATFCSSECRRISKMKANHEHYAFTRKAAEVELHEDTLLEHGKAYWYIDKNGEKVTISSRTIKIVGGGEPFYLKEFEGISVDLVSECTPNMGGTIVAFIKKVLSDFDIKYFEHKED